MNKLQDFNENLQDVIKKMPPQLTVQHVLIFCVLFLVSVGMIMVTSASISFADNTYNNPYHFSIRQGVAIGFSAVVVYLVYRYVSLDALFKYTVFILLGSLALLSIVLFIGVEVNGAKRWINLIVFQLQPTEVAKLALSIYLADYLVRCDNTVKNHIIPAVLRCGIPIGFALTLIFLQPDLGSMIVISVMVVGLLFLAGLSAKLILYIVLVGGIGILAMIIFEPYRLARLTNFVDPFADRYGDGYQNVNALIAYALGEWTGVGLGQSVQKISYLPEAHTDFVMAILGEEFGLLGVGVVIFIAYTMIVCCIYIGNKAFHQQYYRGGYLCYALAIILFLQIFINSSMTLSILPNKGLTFPFVSYGGSSMLVCALMIVLVLMVNQKCNSGRNIQDSEFKS